MNANLLITDSGKETSPRPSLDDLELFVRLAYHVQADDGEVRGALSLELVAEQIAGKGDVGGKLPTVSQTLKRLEGMCGVKLLVRRDKIGIGQLTYWGRKLRSHCKALLWRWSHLNDQLETNNLASDLSKWAHPADLQLFVQIASIVKQVTGRDKALPFYALIERLEHRVHQQFSEATTRQALQRLEKRYGELLLQKQKVGITGLTKRGHEYAKSFRPAVRQYLRLSQWMDSLRNAAQISCVESHTAWLRSSQVRPLTIATTSTLRLRLLTGAIAAYLLRLKLEGAAAEQRYEDWPRVRLHVFVGNYPAIIAGLRQGAFDVGIGWELSQNAYPDIDQQEFLNESVRFKVILGNDLMRGTDLAAWRAISARFPKDVEALNAVHEALHRTALDRLFAEPEYKKQVPLRELRKAMIGLPIAMCRTDYNLRPQGDKDRELRDIAPAELAAEADISKIERVSDYEEVYNAIRSGTSVVGWLPCFFKTRDVQERDVDQIRRNVMVYARRDEQFLPAVKELVDTLKAFVNENSWPEKGADSLANKVRMGESITAEEIVRWVAAKRWKTLNATQPDGSDIS